ncbi:hypothetical protein HLY09_25690 [Enterocloster bolteae]|uniref:hypothetical protein n=1 Tax=Enterocloster bolteae TaxID=208479 RepID=UPI00148CB3B6|nr:hypothetical protein [Enterocloster bolteae]QJU22528.1 hypothetical protein HLY09_25690 [Enterocloster bolteae]
MSKYERVILIIEDYIFDFTEPQRSWDKHWFKEVSYQRWAGNELLNCIRKNPEQDPIDIISDFATKTREFSMKDHADKRDRQIFNVAYEIATDILEITRCLK